MELDGIPQGGLHERTDDCTDLQRFLQFKSNYMTKLCGAGRDRTDDLLNAIQTLSQLSYSPLLKSIKITLIKHAEYKETAELFQELLVLKFVFEFSLYVIRFKRAYVPLYLSWWTWFYCSFRRGFKSHFISYLSYSLLM